MNATVEIHNATDFITSVTIRGTAGFKFDADNRLDWLLDAPDIKTRSYALLCGDKNAKHLHAKRIIEFGHKFPGDLLLHFQREFVGTKKSSVPRLTFNFHDDDVKIDLVVLAISVSESILVNLRHL